VQREQLQLQAGCFASVAGTETGDIAPMSRNGVTIVGWPRFAYSTSAASMRSS